jgi:hypothetical protein
MPYKVTVKSAGKTGLQVDILPFPIATDESYLPVVVRTIQHILNQPRLNTIKGRASMKAELEVAVLGFHKQGMIKPKD